jgi:hypothetical protein
LFDCYPKGGVLLALSILNLKLLKLAEDKGEDVVHVGNTGSGLLTRATFELLCACFDRVEDSEELLEDSPFIG